MVELIEKFCWKFSRVVCDQICGLVSATDKLCTHKHEIDDVVDGSYIKLTQCSYFLSRLISPHSYIKKHNRTLPKPTKFGPVGAFIDSMDDVQNGEISVPN